MKAEMPERTRNAGDGIAKDTRSARQTNAARIGHPGDEASLLMEQVVRRENLLAAYQRVVRNGGAPGVDYVGTRLPSSDGSRFIDLDVTPGPGCCGAALDNVRVEFD